MFLPQRSQQMHIALDLCFSLMVGNLLHQPLCRFCEQPWTVLVVAGFSRDCVHIIAALNTGNCLSTSNIGFNSLETFALYSFSYLCFYFPYFIKMYLQNTWNAIKILYE